MPAVIDIGAVGSASANSGATTTSIARRCNAPNNLLIALEWNYTTGQQIPSSMTFNSVGLTRFYSIPDAGTFSASIWTMPNPPIGGPFTLACNYSSPVSGAALALVFASGVDLSSAPLKAPNETFGSGNNNATLSAPLGRASDLFIMICGNGCTSQSSGINYGQVNLSQQTGINGGYCASCDMGPANGNTFSWSNSGSSTALEWLGIGAVIVGLPLPLPSYAIDEQTEF